MSLPTAPPIPHAGEAAALVAALIWSVTLCVYRAQAYCIPATTINLFKNGISLACLVSYAWALNAAWPDEPMLIAWLAGSGMVGFVLSDTAMFAALKHLGAARTAAMQCISPPVAVFCGWLFLAEALSGFALLGIGVTVVAVAGAMMLGPRDETRLGPHWSLGLLLAVVAAVANAIGIVMARQAFQQVDIATGTIYRLIPAVLVLLIVVTSRGRRAGWEKLAEPPRRGIWLGVTAFFGSFVGMLFYGASIKFAPAGVAATLTSTYPIWLIPIAAGILKERITGGQILCTLVAVGGIGLIFLG
jgi:drug/metabolite transporter (DMT)-like permease